MGKNPHRTVFAPSYGCRVVMIGAGNVATHLSSAMQAAGFQIMQIFSRSEANARMLAEKCDCPYAVSFDEITPAADIYIFALKDDALPRAIAEMPQNAGLWIHTAGSVPIGIFQGGARNYGVMYPLQTLSKDRLIYFAGQVPLLIEGDTPESEQLICRIACAISDNVATASSEQRLRLHLAAVFACNFTNHLYALAEQLLGGRDWRILQPLIDETARKLHDLSPQEAQTGPAVRNDRSVIERHLALLNDKPMQDIYKIMSDSIYNMATKNNRHDKL